MIYALSLSRKIQPSVSNLPLLKYNEFSTKNYSFEEIKQKSEEAGSDIARGMREITSGVEVRSIFINPFKAPFHGH